MKLKTFIALALPLTVILFVLATGMVSGRPVYRVHDGRTISFSAMIDSLRGQDFVFIGEIHDDPDTHVLELETIKALHESGELTAVGLEMFREDSQGALDAWVNGTMPLDKFLPVYYDNWRIAWPLYREIFLYARKHRIPLVGLNISDDIAAAVARNGFSSLGAAEREKLPPNISCNVDPTYMEFIRKAYAGHSPGQDRKFLNFCEAQMVWDKSMAWNLIKYRKNHPGRVIAVLAGVGHAWKQGYHAARSGSDRQENGDVERRRLRYARLSPWSGRVRLLAAFNNLAQFAACIHAVFRHVAYFGDVLFLHFRQLLRIVHDDGYLGALRRFERDAFCRRIDADDGAADLHFLLSGNCGPERNEQHNKHQSGTDPLHGRLPFVMPRECDFLCINYSFILPQTRATVAHEKNCALPIPCCGSRVPGFLPCL
jgi:uncharacterized iron-regulated protein